MHASNKKSRNNGPQISSQVLIDFQANACFTGYRTILAYVIKHSSLGNITKRKSRAAVIGVLWTH